MLTENQLRAVIWWQEAASLAENGELSTFYFIFLFFTRVVLMHRKGVRSDILCFLFFVRFGRPSHLDDVCLLVELLLLLFFC